MTQKEARGWLPKAPLLFACASPRAARTTSPGPRDASSTSLELLAFDIRTVACDEPTPSYQVDPLEVTYVTEVSPEAHRAARLELGGISTGPLGPPRSHGGGGGAEIPAILAAVLAPYSQHASASRAEVVAQLLSSQEPGGHELSYVHALGTLDGEKVYGTALHAAALGACCDPRSFNEVVSMLVQAGAPVATRLKSAQSWIANATPLHLLLIFGLQQGPVVLPSVAALVNQASTLDVAIQGALPTHLTAARMGKLPADHGVVSRLLGRAYMHRLADEFCVPLGIASATPLEAACASDQAGEPALEMLVQQGASVEGEDGARALVACMAAGSRKKAAFLLSKQVAVATPIAMHWPSMCSCPNPAIDSLYFPLGLLPRCTDDQEDLITLTPLQWLLVAAANMLQTDLSWTQIAQLFKEALGGMRPDTRLGEMPALTCSALHTGTPRCSASYYLLTYCPLQFTAIALGRRVFVDDVWLELDGLLCGRNALGTLLRRPSGDDHRALCNHVQMLVDAGVDASKCDDDTGNNALHSLPQGFEALYALFKTSGCDIHMPNYFGFTPLHTAVAAGDPYVVRLLLLDSVSAAVAAEDGATPLHLAVAHPEAELRLMLVRTLVKANAPLDAVDENGETPLDIAERANEPDRVVEFLQHQAELRLNQQRRTVASQRLAPSPPQEVHSTASPPGDVQTTSSSLSYMNADALSGTTMAEDAPESATFKLPKEVVAVAASPPPAAPGEIEPTPVPPPLVSEPFQTEPTGRRDATGADRMVPVAESRIAAEPSAMLHRRIPSKSLSSTGTVSNERVSGSLASVTQKTSEGSLIPAGIHSSSGGTKHGPDPAASGASRLKRAAKATPTTPTSGADVRPSSASSAARPSSATTTTKRATSRIGSGSRTAARTAQAERDSARTGAKRAGRASRGAERPGGREKSTTSVPPLRRPSGRAKVAPTSSSAREVSGREASCKSGTSMDECEAPLTSSEAGGSGRAHGSGYGRSVSSTPTRAKSSRKELSSRRRVTDAQPGSTRSGGDRSQASLSSASSGSSAQVTGASQNSHNTQTTHSAHPPQPPGGLEPRLVSHLTSGQSSVHSAATKASIMTLPRVQYVEQGQQIIQQILSAGGLIDLHARIGDNAFRALIGTRLEKNQTLLHCLRDQQEQLVRPFVNMGMSPNSQDDEGNTPMHTAASGGQASVLRMLMMCDADPTIRNGNGQDVLLCGVRCRDKEGALSVVRTLMKFGMRADVADESGKTALDVAEQLAAGNAEDDILVYMRRQARLQSIQKRRQEERRAAEKKS